MDEVSNESTDKEYRRMDDLGRIALPKMFRERLDYHDGDRFEITICDDSESIVIRKTVEP